MKKFFLILVLIFVGENALIFFPKIKSFVLQKEENKILKGWKVASKLGCFSCHGALGEGKILNPGGEDEERFIPGFKDEEAKKHLTDENETKEFKEIILKGQKENKKEEHKAHSSFFKKLISPKIVYAHNEKEETENGHHPKKKGIIKMDGYKKYLTSDDLENLIIFLKANAQVLNPKTELEKKGKDLVIKNSCFVCHGTLGAGGIKNPGSLKGYIPSLIGKDYNFLVRNDSELVEWIKTGKVSHILNHPIGKIFLKRQVVQMPAYGKNLNKEEIDLIVLYVKWLRKEIGKYN